MASQAASTSLVQKCRKTGTNATCCVIPSTICKRFADHPSKSLRARLGPETLTEASPLSRPLQERGSSSHSLAHPQTGYQPAARLSIVGHDGIQCAGEMTSAAFDHGFNEPMDRKQRQTLGIEPSHPA